MILLGKGVAEGGQGSKGGGGPVLTAISGGHMPMIEAE